MTRPDSPSWEAAKTAGDAAELAIARWWRKRGFTVHKTIGEADHDLRLTLDIEVKRDLQAKQTGNVAVEVSYRGQPSGIVTSRAAFWQIVVNGESLLIRTDALRALALERRWHERPAGDGGMARVRLVALDQLRRRAHRVIRLAEGAP